MTGKAHSDRERRQPHCLLVWNIHLGLPQLPHPGHPYTDTVCCISSGGLRGGEPWGCVSLFGESCLFETIKQHRGEVLGQLIQLDIF